MYHAEESEVVDEATPTDSGDTIDACGPPGKVGCLPLTQDEKAGIMQAAVMSKSVY